MLSELYEQLLIFDTVRISTNRINSQLFILIKHLGIEIVERLLISGYIEFMIWPSHIFTSLGTGRNDGSIDESTIMGQVPIVGGSLSDADLDQERNILIALNKFNLPTKRKREFLNLALKRYQKPEKNGLQISSNSAELVIDAYKSDNFADLGLPFEKQPDQLNVHERGILLDVGNRLLETAILAKENLKSYNNYEHYAICKQNLQNIGKAYNIADNTSRILFLEDLPNLKEIYLNGNLDFESVFRIRHLSTAKYYRQWINDIGESSNSREVTRECLREIKGKYKYFNTTHGKILKNAGIFVAGLGLTALLKDPSAGVVGSYALGLVDDLWLDSILRGKSPSMFIDNLRDHLKHESHEPDDGNVTLAG
jgi:hypothetical protein